MVSRILSEAKAAAKRRLFGNGWKEVLRTAPVPIWNSFKVRSYIIVVLDPGEPRHTVATALRSLPPFEQSLLKSYYIDGDSVPTL